MEPGRPHRRSFDPGGTIARLIALKRAMAAMPLVAVGDPGSAVSDGRGAGTELMALSLVCTMLAAVLFQPVLMGPPRAAK